MHTAGLDQSDFQALFEAAPGAYLVLRPDAPVYTILFANKAYTEATMTEQAQIAGRGLFEIFPDNPDDPHATGERNLRASLDQVLATGISHSMQAQKYDIQRRTQTLPSFETRYWSPVNTPVLQGRTVCFIIHCVQDVTEFIRLKAIQADGAKVTAGVQHRTDTMEAELFLRARQLDESQRLIQEHDEFKRKLLTTEARYSLAFAQAPIGMVLLSPDGTILEVNQAYVDMLGYTREEMLSHDSSRFTHRDDIELTKSFFVSLRKGSRRTGSIEKRYLRKDGEILWARASGTMRGDDQGKPAELIAIVEDITARKRAEARYRFLAESIPQMVWTARPDGMLDYVNGQGTKYFGAQQRALIADGWLKYVHPDEQASAVKAWRSSLATGQPYETAFRLRRHGDGAWRWHLARALALTGDNGNIVQWFGTCTDIEDQRVADAQLRQQWHTFDTALSHTPDFIYIFDLEFRLTYANRALLALWETTLPEVRGKTFLDLSYPPDLARRMGNQIRHVVEKGQSLRDYSTFSGPGGEARFHEYILVPVFNTNGRVEAIAGYTRDITEQKLAANESEKDRQRWRDLLLQTPAGIALLQGPEHRFEWANAYYCQMVGRSAGSLEGVTVIEAFPEVEGQIFLELLNGVYRSGEPFIGREVFLSLQNEAGLPRLMYVNFVYLAITDAAGSVNGIFVHVTDVTDLVVARKRIEASEERFRLAFKAVEGIVYDWNPQTGVVERSGNLENLIGIKPDAAVPSAQWWQERVHPEDVEKSSLNRLALLAEESDHFETEFRLRHADGRWIYALDRGYIVRDESGAVVRVVGSTHDVTEERILFDALRKSEAMFRQAIDSMPQLVWSTLAGGNPDLYNRQWHEYTGIPAGEQNSGVWSPVHPEDRPLVVERWTHSLDTGKPFELEFRCRRFDGQYRWFLSRAQAIRDDKGSIVRWFGTSTDIEDRKKAEMAVLTKQKLESLGLLAGGIAHDFNNLLVGVLGGASYAADDLPLDHPLQPILDGIVSAAERAAHLTRQMLAYAGKGRFVVESIDIGELAGSTCDLIKGSIPKNVQVVLESSGILPVVEADSSQMQQIVMNLILNGVESIDSGKPGTVTVRIRAEDLDSAALSRFDLLSGNIAQGPYLVFEVEDNGSGMDRDTQTKIFDPFFTTKFTGRGLGLSAVQGILRTHNGALEVKSSVGKGSTFRVFLPASGKASPRDVPPPRRSAPSTGAGTVLVVEDEEIVRATTQASLERSGFQVILAESGAQALRILTEEGAPPIHLIILDMGMPVMNGKDVLERIRLLGIDIPVMICSGYSEAEIHLEFSAQDIAGFIQKPFSARHLVDKIREAFPEPAV